MTNYSQQNKVFWNEVCGSYLASVIGINKTFPPSLEDLAKFDKAFFEQYPYFKKYLLDVKDKKVLETGLGYGTLGRWLIANGAIYTGVDIAENPVKIMNSVYPGIAIQEDALSLPFQDNTFDIVYSIGCFHHTGDIKKCIDEAYRVLKPNGEAVIMLYNKYSFRRLFQNPETHKGDGDAPCTEYTSLLDVKKLFCNWKNVKVDIQNFDRQTVLRGNVIIARELFLRNIARVLGMDLYILATK